MFAKCRSVAQRCDASAWPPAGRRVRLAVGGEASEGADLEDAPVALFGVDDRAPLGDELCHRLFAHDVLSRRHRRRRDQRVPVGRRGNRHDVDVAVLEHAAIVGVDGLVVGAVEELHVALGHEADARPHRLERGPAAAAGPDQRPAELLAGRRLAPARHVARHYRRSRRAGRRPVEKTPPADCKLGTAHFPWSPESLLSYLPAALSRRGDFISLSLSCRRVARSFLTQQQPQIQPCSCSPTPLHDASTTTTYGKYPLISDQNRHRSSGTSCRICLARA